MEIILTSDIDDIGLAGEVKTVKNGLARNYLIPGKLAIEATEANLRDWRKKLEVLKQKREKNIAEAQAFADKIDGTVIKIETKLSDGKKMFGSVSVQTIAEALKEQYGLEVEKRNILLEKNIKFIGRFEVPVRVKAHIKASVIVQITTEEDEETQAAADATDAQSAEEQNAPQDETGRTAEAAEARGKEAQDGEAETVEEQTKTESQETPLSAEENKEEK